MIGVLEQAVHRVFQETIGEDVSPWDQHVTQGYISTISLKRASDIPLHLIIRPDMLKALADILFADPEPDEGAMQDLSCEMANLIAGCAKTIASEEPNSHFTISTPTFIGNQEMVEQDAIRSSFRFREEIFTMVLGHNDA